MYPFGKPIAEVTAADILAVDEPENLRLDYKLDLSCKAGGDWKGEFRKDVAAFANTVGGALILGIGDKGGAPSPHRPGTEFFRGKSGEQIAQQLRSALDTGVEPHLPNVQIYAVQNPNDPALHFVLVLVDGQSWLGPHWVTTSNRSVIFYARSDCDNKAMVYEQLSRAFEARIFRERGLESYRDECLSDISAGLTPVGVLGPSYLVHFVPYSISRNTYRLDLSTLDEQEYVDAMLRFTWPEGQIISPTGDLGFDFRGASIVVGDKHFPDRSFSYLRLFRTGMIEIADLFSIPTWKRIEAKTVWRDLEHVVVRLIQLSESLGVLGPYEVFFSLWNIDGVPDGPRTMQRPNFLFPGIQVTTADDAPTELKPLAHHIAQTFGASAATKFSDTWTYRDLPTPWKKHYQ